MPGLLLPLQSHSVRIIGKRYYGRLIEDARYKVSPSVCDTSLHLSDCK